MGELGRKMQFGCNFRRIFRGIFRAVCMKPSETTADTQKAGEGRRDGQNMGATPRFRDVARPRNLSAPSALRGSLPFLPERNHVGTSASQTPRMKTLSHRGKLCL